MPVVRVQGDRFETVEDLVCPHLSQAVQQGPGIFQHHAGLLAFVHQLGNELAHPLVAPQKDRRVVVVPDLLVVHHVLQVANNFRSAEIAATRRNERLVHVQRDGACAPDAPKIYAAVLQINCLPRFGLYSLCTELLHARDVGKAVKVFGYIVHSQKLTPLFLFKLTPGISRRRRAIPTLIYTEFVPGLTELRSLMIPGKVVPHSISMV